MRIYYFFYSFLFLFCLSLNLLFAQSSLNMDSTYLKTAKDYIKQGQNAYEQGRIKESMDQYYRALMYDPTSAEAHFGLGLAYEKDKKWNEAIREFSSTITFNPGFTQGYIHLAALYFKDKKNEDGFKTYFKALAFNGRFSLTLLESQKVSKRRKVEIETLKDYISSNHSSKKRIFIYSDLTPSNTLIFFRYLEKLKSSASKLLFQPNKNLVELFKGSLRDIEIVDWLALEDDIAYDIKAPLAALPFIYNEILKPTSVLKIDEKELKEIQEWISPSALNIGVAWKPKGSIDFFTGLDLPYNIYSLQSQKQPGELSALIDDGDSVMELGSAISKLDLILSFDTEIAVLAASLNKPCWLLLTSNEDWLWIDQEQNNPWFKNLKIWIGLTKDDLKKELETHLTQKSK